VLKVKLSQQPLYSPPATKSSRATTPSAPRSEPNSPLASTPQLRHLSSRNYSVRTQAAHQINNPQQTATQQASPAVTTPSPAFSTINNTQQQLDHRLSPVAQIASHRLQTAAPTAGLLSVCNALFPKNAHELPGVFGDSGRDRLHLFDGDLSHSSLNSQYVKPPVSDRGLTMVVPAMVVI
jgi:hypothetical protein